MTDVIGEILTRIRRKRAVDLSCYRLPLLERRLAARMDRLLIGDLRAYLRRLDSDPSETDQLIDAIAIGFSSFFRDPHVFEALRVQALPRIIADTARRGAGEIRAWSAGCGMGEEPYSLAILLRDYLRKVKSDLTPRVFATDINRKALQSARTGIYPRESFATTQLGVLDRYFSPRGEGFRILPALRDAVIFSGHDLLSKTKGSPPESVFGSFDLVFCRNVLIYFRRARQKQILDRLYEALAPGGFLVLGEAEAAVSVAPGLKRLPPVRAVFQRV